MKIVISGAHRTGKSKLAEAIAAALGLPYLRSSLTEILRSVGFDGNSNLRYPDRMIAQDALCAAYDKLFRDNPSFVSDRGHFDFLLYTYMDVGNDFPADSKLEYAVESYVTKCVEESKGVDALYLLQPGIPIVAADGKGSAVRPLLDKLNLLALGLIQQHGIPCTIVPHDCLDFDARVDFVMRDLKSKQLINP